METNLKQSSSVGRISSIDVSQLDKINAIPNKITDNILMDGLCNEDQLYINALMDNDTEVDDDEDTSRRSSAWSPMVQSPVVMNKRIKKLRPSYAVTLSLEDISYIRPSWGLSKGIRTIEINKSKKQTLESERSKAKAKDEKNSKKSGSNEPTYYYFMILLTLVLLVLTVPTYIADSGKEQKKILTNRIKVNSRSRSMEIYKLKDETLEPILNVHFGQGIPQNLKGDECTCEIFTTETGRYDKSQATEDRQKTCFSCLDWAFRANLRVLVDSGKAGSDSDSFCYTVRWQSYDNLVTPLVDCFVLDDQQWFGLGDSHASTWDLNKISYPDWTTLVTNLTSEFPYQNNDDQVQSFKGNTSNQLPLGSYVNYSLLSNNGIFIGDVRTDFEVSFRIATDPELGVKRACLSVSCTDKCTQNWSRLDHLDEFKYRNNMLEYKICLANSLKTLVSRQLEEKTRYQLNVARKFTPNNEVFLVNRTGANSTGSGSNNSSLSLSLEKIIERESSFEPVTGDSSRLEQSLPANQTSELNLPDGIGLIERTIFAISPEFMPALYGQTLRQYVDNIVKLGLKASSILLIDTRWESYVGSLKLNVVLFPKAKLLFEILHNKGFKILFTIKPYVDAGIGISSINQLFESGRLYAASYEWDSHKAKSASQVLPTVGKQGTLIRRKSLFTYQNQSINTEAGGTVNLPYLFRCKESQEGYCALIDLTQSSNRAWLITNIKRSNLLTQEADGIQIGGTCPNSFQWDDHYRASMSELTRNLVFKERLYTLPQWTGDFGYIQLAPRPCTWDGLRSVLNSVLNLGMLGFSLVHPGSVWGDLKLANSTHLETVKPTNRKDSIYGDVKSSERSDDLLIRWLQVSMFLPILQFNNIAPIERHGLQDLVQNLVRIRKTYIVPELKRNLPFTPLVTQSKSDNPPQLPLIRPVWYSLESGESIVNEQFSIGPDILVAPILGEGLRQRDIYLPPGFWRDELRQLTIRGGKWLRNYPVELNEIAWFTRAKRRR